MSILAGCACGGIICFSAAVVTDNFGDTGLSIGIPLGLLFVVLVPVLAVRFFRGRTL